eukprot:1526340-Alexandrium_andersonii.AAC.1
MESPIRNIAIDRFLGRRTLGGQRRAGVPRLKWYDEELKRKHKRDEVVLQLLANEDSLWKGMAKRLILPSGAERPHQTSR